MVFDITAADDEQAAMEGIDKMEAFFRDIDMPTNLKELGVDATEKSIVGNGP
jgi:alcohol dehydrogenase YqhD (iron-dependent ADH family)